jgi:putative membrane protein
MTSPYPASGPDPAVILAVAVLGAYLLGVARRRRRDPRGWSRWRTLSFGLGILLLTAALTGPLADREGFPSHVLGHLLLGMLAPLALVLGAPVTLLIRAVETRDAHRVVRLLRSRPARLLTHPFVVLIANVGGVYLLYLTPLYRAASTYPSVHDLVHLHFLISGFLFSWIIAGPDPGPRRVPVPTRLIMLGVAVIAHATLSQLMYAGLLARVPEPADQVRTGATLMYYGADLAEILLAVAMLANWRPARPGSPRRPAWYRRRTASAGPAPRSEAGPGSGHDEDARTAR